MNIKVAAFTVSEKSSNTFIHHALTGACCELFYRYRMYQAPFTAMLTTARHITFNKNKKVHTKNIDGESDSKDERRTSDCRTAE